MPDGGIVLLPAYAAPKVEEVTWVCLVFMTEQPRNAYGISYPINVIACAGEVFDEVVEASEPDAVLDVRGNDQSFLIVHFCSDTS